MPQLFSGVLFQKPLWHFYQKSDLQESAPESTLPRESDSRFHQKEFEYGLFVNGQLLGIIEAKKVTVGPENVLKQAKRYAAGAYNGIGNWDGFRVLSFMRVAVKSFGTWPSDPRSVFLARSKAFIQRKRYDGYSTET
jgi:type I site-specific restriction endonuclease